MSQDSVPRVPDVTEEEEYWLRLLSDLGSEPSIPLSMKPSPDPFPHPNLEQSTHRSYGAESTHEARFSDKLEPNTGSRGEEGIGGTAMRDGAVGGNGASVTDQHDEREYKPLQLDRPHGFNHGPDSPAEFLVQTPNYPPPVPPGMPEQNSRQMQNLKGIAVQNPEDGEPEQTGPDVWGDSDPYVADQIDFIFCNKEDYEDPQQYGNERVDALALCRSSLILLQPVLRTAVDYAAEKVRSTGQALYDSAAAKFSSRLETSDALSEHMYLTNTVGEDGASVAGRDLTAARLGPSLGSLHQTIVFLARHLDSAALSRYVRTASGTVVTLRDIAVMHIARYVRSNVYLSSFVGCVHESTLFMVDRLRAGVELYSHILQGDDPEQMHLELLKDKPDWQHLLLRCSMASLTWKQRQLLEETRDGGSISAADFKRLVQAQILEFDRRRVARITNEYFYLTPESMHAQPAPINNSLALYAESTQDGVRWTAGKAGPGVLPARDEEESPSAMAAEKVNTDALKAILTDTASIDQLASAAGVDTQGMDAVEASKALGKLKSNIHSWLVEEASMGDEDAQYALARFFTPPAFAEAKECTICSRAFSITLFRHHCRFCGRSVCDDHSKSRRCIYRYGLITPVRVCQQCADAIDETHRMDAIIWKDLRISAYLRNKLIPYFTPAVDRGIDKVFRVADYSIAVAKNALTYNLPAKIALETVDVLKRYGLTGFTGLLLRKDFIESVEMLKQISGMESMFTLSLHELTACVYYKLAIERGLRGSNPEGERLAHSPHTRKSKSGKSHRSAPHAVDYDCRDASDADLQLAIRYAPLALNIIYEENPVDCQRLAKLQGWDMVFTNVESELVPEQPCYALFATSFPESAEDARQGARAEAEVVEAAQAWAERRPVHPTVPSSSLAARYAFASAAVGGSHPVSAPAPGRKGVESPQENTNKSTPLPQREAVLVIRGTQTIQDVVTDIRATPQMFPPSADEIDAALRGSSANNGNSSIHREEPAAKGMPEDSPAVSASGKWDWTSVPSHHTYSCGGMVRSAMYVLREVGPALRRLHAEGYKIVLTGHSLGGAVAALLTYILKDAIPSVTSVTYGCPSCLDAATADLLKDRVLSVVLHDDAISRITPQSIRMLMRELMVFREQMFQHLQQEWVDVLRRAAGLWTPRWRLAAAPPGQSAEKFLSAACNSGAVGNAVQVKLMTMNAELDEVSLDETGGVRSKAWEPSVGEEDDAATHGVDSAPVAAAAPPSVASSVMVEEERLAPLWLPGRVMHIYICNGQCFASEVSRDFPDLRSIVLQGNIFEDHRSERIQNALLEVRAVRQARTPAPAWQGFDASDTCACCRCSFTWNSTFTGQAQEFRDKYNCRNCGRLVCDACSLQRRAIPRYGHILPKRICDQCVHKGDFATM